MGACGSRAHPITRPGGALIAPRFPRSDDELEEIKPTRTRTDSIQGRFVVQLRKSAEEYETPGQEADPDLQVDYRELPWRHFVRGAMVGCGIVAIPMAVLIWIVVSNGILYRLYPLPNSE